MAQVFRPARPDLEAHEHAARVEFPVAVKELTDLLGPKLVAYLAGVTETRAVRQWAEREREARDPIPARLRLALHVALLIGRHDDARVAQAWFQGLNPQLDDRSPARLLREGDLDEVGPLMLSAARAFVRGLTGAGGGRPAGDRARRPALPVCRPCARPVVGHSAPGLWADGTS